MCVHVSELDNKRKQISHGRANKSQPIKTDELQLGNSE